MVADSTSQLSMSLAQLKLERQEIEKNESRKISAVFDCRPALGKFPSENKTTCPRAIRLLGQRTADEYMKALHDYLNGQSLTAIPDIELRNVDLYPSSKEI